MGSVEKARPTEAGLMFKQPCKVLNVTRSINFLLV